MPNAASRRRSAIAAMAFVVGPLVMGRPGPSGVPSTPVSGALPVAVSADRDPGSAAARAALRHDLRAMDAAFARLSTCAGRHRRRCATRALADARRAYKDQEALIELLAPATAAALNGRRQEVDDDEAPPPGAAPSAFAAIETALAGPLGTRPRTARLAPQAVVRAATAARATVVTLAAQLGDFQLTRPVLVEAARLEVARVATLGVTGFDTPDTHAGVRESAVALRGVGALAAAALGPDAPCRRAIARAAGYAAAHPDFARFDRVRFLAAYTEPALRALEVDRGAAGVPRLQRPRAWTGATLFERAAFSARAYAPETAPLGTPALVALGARLFADPALSGDGTRACVSCHQPARAFTDGRAAPLARPAIAHAPATRTLRNTPSLLTAAYEPALFADGRAVTLEDQAAAVLASPAEMGSSAEQAAARVGRSPPYVAGFQAALGARPSALGVRQALAAYVRSLGGEASRVDRAFRGDSHALTSRERRGANLFLGRAGCGTCHYAPRFAGSTPPLFRSTDAEVLGVPAVGGGRRRIDPDSGRGAIDGRPEHVHAFKTPSLRHVARTAPYMHNGVFRTLEAVVDFYDRGGGRGIGLRVPNQTLPDRPLGLTSADRRALLAFLRAL